MHQYFTDKDYREFIVDLYDIFKENFNIFDVINHSKHYYAMLEALDTHLELITSVSSRANFLLKEGRQLYNPKLVRNKITEIDPNTGLEETITLFRLPKTYKEKVARKLNPLFDDYVISEFLRSTTDYDFTYRRLAGGEYKIDYGKSVRINRNTNIAQFIQFMNGTLIPTLKRNYPENKFLQALIPDLDAASGKRGAKKMAVKWKFNFDIDDLNDPSNSNKYYDVVGGFMELLAPKVNGERQYLTLGDIFGSQITKNPDVKVADLLYIYD